MCAEQHVNKSFQQQAMQSVLTDQCYCLATLPTCSTCSDSLTVPHMYASQSSKTGHTVFLLVVSPYDGPSRPSKEAAPLSTKRSIIFTSFANEDSSSNSESTLASHRHTHLTRTHESYCTLCGMQGLIIMDAAYKLARSTGPQSEEAAPLGKEQRLHFENIISQ